MNFRKIASFALVLAMGTGILGSCSEGDKTAMNTNITVTSSAADEAADILQTKLPELDRRVILGTAETAESYGVDLSDFESDGYIIKAQDDSVLLFGKTEDGLYTATNKFVNQYNAGTVEDVAYHEGQRIEKLEIFGIDISEYVIEYPENHNDNMRFAVAELVQLVKKATGVELPYHVGDSGAKHVIEFRFSDDESLKNDGYRYYEENGTLVLEGAVARGCMNAVYRFLENECGWDQLIGGESILQESDYINIPAGIDKTETPAFEYLFIHNQIWERFKTDRTEIANNSIQNSYGAVTNACHGILHFLDSSDGWQNQPCYTSEDTYEMIYERVEDYIKGEIAKGRTPGVDLIEIDIAQTDSSVYCTCPDCIDVYIEEGNAHSGAVVRFANRLSEELNEKYPGIVYKIFAYADSNKPCKTVPNDLVYITYCFDGNCANHPLDGTECNGGLTGYGRSSEDYAEWFEGWTELTDNLYVWFYALDTNFHDYTVIDTIYRDFPYLAEHGVKGIFYQSTNHGLGMKRIDHQLVYELNWNIDMTEEEYYELYYKLLEKEYGPGWEFVRDYLDGVSEAQDLAGCWHCWGWNIPNLKTNAYYNTVHFGREYDYFVEIMDRAIDMAESKDDVKRCEMLTIGTLYKGCYSLYFEAYENDDAELMSKLSERYDRAMALMKKYGFKMEDGIGAYTTVDGSICPFHYESIDDAAWLDWYEQWDKLCPGHTKPVPDEYKELVETTRK